MYYWIQQFVCIRDMQLKYSTVNMCHMSIKNLSYAVGSIHHYYNIQCAIVCQSSVCLSSLHNVYCVFIMFGVKLSYLSSQTWWYCDFHLANFAPCRILIFSPTYNILFMIIIHLKISVVIQTNMLVMLCVAVWFPQYGQSTLHDAAEQGNLGIARILLENGASLSIQDKVSVDAIINF